MVPKKALPGAPENEQKWLVIDKVKPTITICPEKQIQMQKELSVYYLCQKLMNFLES